MRRLIAVLAALLLLTSCATGVVDHYTGVGVEATLHDLDYTPLMSVTPSVSLHHLTRTPQLGLCNEVLVSVGIPTSYGSKDEIVEGMAVDVDFDVLYPISLGRTELMLGCGFGVHDYLESDNLHLTAGVDVKINDSMRFLSRIRGGVDWVLSKDIEFLMEDALLEFEIGLLWHWTTGSDKAE